MNQILVKVFIPTLEKSYDVLIPQNKKIYNVILLLVKVIDDLNDNCFATKSMPFLYDKASGRMFNLEDTIRESKILNGSELIII